MKKKIFIYRTRFRSISIFFLSVFIFSRIFSRLFDIKIELETGVLRNEIYGMKSFEEIERIEFYRMEMVSWVIKKFLEMEL
jgi:hypothetical protein